MSRRGTSLRKKQLNEAGLQRGRARRLALRRGLAARAGISAGPEIAVARKRRRAASLLVAIGGAGGTRALQRAAVARGGTSPIGVAISRRSSVLAGTICTQFLLGLQPVPKIGSFRPAF